MSKISDIRSLVELWPEPSSKNFALDLGVEQNSVSTMIARNTIRQHRLYRIFNAAKRRGIDLTAEEILKVLGKDEVKRAGPTKQKAKGMEAA